MSRGRELEGENVGLHQPLLTLDVQGEGVGGDGALGVVRLAGVVAAGGGTDVLEDQSEVAEDHSPGHVLSDSLALNKTVRAELTLGD